MLFLLESEGEGCAHKEANKKEAKIYTRKENAFEQTELQMCLFMESTMQKES